MGISQYHGETKYIGDPITMLRGTVADILTVKTLHTAAGQPSPAPADFTETAILVADASHPLWAGTPEVVTHLGPRGDVILTVGDWQRWVLLSTADEDEIDAPSTVTILP